MAINKKKVICLSVFSMPLTCVSKIKKLYLINLILQIIINMSRVKQLSNNIFSLKNAFRKIFKNFAKINKTELVLILGVLSIAAFSHAYNMFQFPYYDNDEGAYISQAWSVLTQGKLAPYNYWYDHAPLGWLIISLWTLLSGGFFTFGSSINSGRVLMFIVHLVSTILIYLITKRVTKSFWAGLTASVIFSLTPLGIYYQRRVLLDNLMLPWVLASFYLLISQIKESKYLFVSAALFGAGLLTKESAILFFPTFIYLIKSQADKIKTRWAVFKWVLLVVLIISPYIIYAAARGEFFPEGVYGGNKYVSLIGAIIWQLSRPGKGNFWEPESDFQWNLAMNWFGKDPLIVVLGVAATFTSGVLSLRNKNIRYLFLLTVSYWVYLMRGGLVFDFYVIPLIPLLSVLIAVNVYAVLKLLKKSPLGKIAFYPPFSFLFGVVVALAVSHVYKDKSFIYRQNQTITQVKAIEWLKKNVPENSVIITDTYAFVDLQSKTPISNASFEKAFDYWKSQEYIINDKALKNDWRNVDYILSSSQSRDDAFRSNLEVVIKAYENSSLVEEFKSDGHRTEIRQVRK
jgi:4-amino-4-deoxy-L-arabinose transferase-like glycosyltransferase